MNQIMIDIIVLAVYLVFQGWNIWISNKRHKELVSLIAALGVDKK